MNSIQEEAKGLISRIPHPNKEAQAKGRILYLTTDNSQFIVYNQAIQHQVELIKNGGKTMSTATVEQQLNMIKVKAYSREHAAKAAATIAGIDLASIETVNTNTPPGKAKACVTNDFPVKGTRKWITVYNIYSYGQKIAVGRDKYQYTHMELVEGGFDQKVPAVARARELAIKWNMPMTVKIEKELDGSNPFVSDIEPKTEKGTFTVGIRA